MTLPVVAGPLLRAYVYPQYGTFPNGRGVAPLAVIALPSAQVPSVVDDEAAAIAAAEGSVMTDAHSSAIDAVVRTFGEARYGGAYFAAADVLVIRVKGLTAPEALQAAALAPPNVARVVASAFSELEAQAGADRVGTNGDLLPVDVLLAVEIDQQTDLYPVIIHVGRIVTDAEMQTLTAGVSQGLWRVQLTPDMGSRNHTQDRRKHESPLVGGRRMSDGPDKPRADCTAGWLYYDRAASADDHIYGSTSGHCFRLSNDVYNGGRYLGNVRYNAYQDKKEIFHDVLLVNLLGDTEAPRRPQIYISDQSTRIVKQVASNRTQPPGTKICITAARSENVSCGKTQKFFRRVKDYDNDGNFTGKYVRNLICGNYKSRPGDSGSPIYYPIPHDPEFEIPAARAYGTHTSAVIDSRRAYDCYQTIEQQAPGLPSNITLWRGGNGK